MNKFIRISAFSEQLFPDEKVTYQASEIIEGIMAARSPRLSDIAAQMSGSEAACYKRIQRFLKSHDPQEALKLLFNEEADFVIGDPAARRQGDEQVSTAPQQNAGYGHAGLCDQPLGG